MKNNSLKHTAFSDLKTKIGFSNDLRDDLALIHELSRRSDRFITCSICGKSFTKASMVSHQRSKHSDFQG